MRIKCRKGYMEPASMALDAWIKNLRLGTMSAQIGSVKGVITPLAQGVYYDKEDLLDQHAQVEVTGEGEGAVRKRIVEPLVVNGQKVGERVLLKDDYAYNKALRVLLDEELIVDVPLLFEDKHIGLSERAIAKVTTDLPSVDFGALRCLWMGTAVPVEG